MTDTSASLLKLVRSLYRYPSRSFLVHSVHPPPAITAAQTLPDYALMCLSRLDRDCGHTTALEESRNFLLCTVFEFDTRLRSLRLCLRIAIRSAAICDRGN